MKLKWALNELKKYQDEGLPVEGEVNLEKELKEKTSQILSAKPLKIKGLITVEKDFYSLYLNVHAHLVLPSSRSLNPVPFEMDFVIDEIYLPTGSEEKAELFSDEDIVIELEKDMLDLIPIITDNVIAALPFQVYTQEELDSKEMPSGNDWKVVPEEEYENSVKNHLSEEGDPRFSALKSLFTQEEEQ
ncbi:YceD family protein [Lacticigenium naphthae]|uniref:YceD family protein n=1 Tax=Lacticigenium naphthae TaxID=515351 RepID=UPI00040B28B6|nr:YceD family protein [Lacticigenium naphthae]